MFNELCFIKPTVPCLQLPSYFNDEKNYFNNISDIKHLYDKSDYKNIDEFLINEYIRYDENQELINLVMVKNIKIYNYYKKSYIENLIYNKENISIIEFNFLSLSNKNKYKKCNLFVLYKKYTKII